MEVFIMRIAVFDSGIGGITVLKEAIKTMPNNDYIYYADTLNVPYGTKPKAQVKEIIFNAVDFISKLDIDALVIACNTATSIAAAELRQKYSFPIIGMEPAVKPALKIAKETSNRILVFATPLTLKENKFIDLIEKIDDEKIVDFLPLPELVENAEIFDFSRETFFSYIKNKLDNYNLNNYSAVVLGCTHFVLYRELFNMYLPPHISVIDGNKGTVAQLKRVLDSLQVKTTSSKCKISFYTSGMPMEETYKLKIYEHLLL
jgi:glutamate racemase